MQPRETGVGPPLSALEREFQSVVSVVIPVQVDLATRSYWQIVEGHPAKPTSRAPSIAL